MANFSHFALQKALYDSLTADVTLMGMVDGVYDRVPDTADYPYVTIGDLQMRNWSSKTFTGSACNVEIHSWSREGGRKESAAIMERIHNLLHDQPINITGQTLVMLRFVSSDILLERDGWSYHGITRYEALMQAD